MIIFYFYKMNRTIFTLFLFFVCSATTIAQVDNKVKGDRNVTVKQTYIDPFSKIIVGEGFIVELIYNTKPSVEIETDDNLHEYIEFGVSGGVLTFKTTKQITSSKKMNIKVNYADGLNSIETIEKGEIRSLTSLELENTSLKTSGASKTYLNIRTGNFEFTAGEKSRSKLNINAKASTITLSDNSKVEALLNSKTAKIDMYQKASANFEGDVDELTLRTDLSSSFTGKELSTNNCMLIAEGSSNATVRVNGLLTTSISGSSEVYFYGMGKIALEKFLDSAKLQKKEK